MTLEEIEKEKAEKLQKAPAIQPDKAEVEKPELNSTKLGKSNPADTPAPSKESNRQYAKKVDDYKRVVEMAKEKGVDLNNIGEMPLMDSDKGKITDAVKRAYGRELATGIQGISDSITAPKNEERKNIDVKALMNLEKQKRRLGWADIMYAAAEGFQGKSVDPDKFASTKLQRKQDEQFQAYKDVTVRNQKAKFIFENQTKKELINWAEDQAKNEKLDAKERARFQQLADHYNKTTERSDRDAAERERPNRAMENKSSGSGSDTKGEKTVKIKTAQKTYELKPEEAAFYKGEILKNAETLRKKYPGWFTETQSEKQNKSTGEMEKGPITFKLNPQVSDTDMIRAYLESKEYHPFDNVVPQSSPSYFDKYRKEKGLPLSTDPILGTTKQAATQPKQSGKADPLGLGL
jgi:hypothetical protein